MAMRAQSQQIDQSQDAYSEKDSFDNEDIQSQQDFDQIKSGNSSGKDMIAKKSKTHKRP